MTAVYIAAGLFNFVQSQVSCFILLCYAKISELFAGSKTQIRVWYF